MRDGRWAMNSPKVLLTDATGFIGGATLAQLLQGHPQCQVLLLVRGATVSAAANRVRQSLGRFIEPVLLEPALDQCQILCGDLTDPTCLDQPRFHEVSRVLHSATDKSLSPVGLEDVTHVLHLASNTSFRSVRGVRHTNILGALTLAHRMRRVPGLQRFLYVGTAYICGAESERVVREDDFPHFGARHLVEYTRSKAECEMLLDRTAPELPLVVARPSVVVGHTRLGCGPSASLFWFYRTVDLLRRIACPLDSYDDAVPVDYVAEALLLLLFKPSLRHRRYHVSAGESSSVRWRDIAAAFAKFYGVRPEGPYQVVDYATIVRERERLQQLLGPGDEAHLLMALQIYFRFMEVNVQIFDNTRLLQEGMPPPPPFTSYLPVCASQGSSRSVYLQMLDDE
jgi:nucleoside-diphosphate-sugar epimerase